MSLPNLKNLYQMDLGIGKVPNPNGTQLPLPLSVLLFNVHIAVRVRSKDEANRSKTGKVMMIGCYCCLQARFRCHGLSNGSVYQKSKFSFFALVTRVWGFWGALRRLRYTLKARGNAKYVFDPPRTFTKSVENLPNLVPKPTDH